MIKAGGAAVRLCVRSLPSEVVGLWLGGILLLRGSSLAFPMDFFKIFFLSEHISKALVSSTPGSNCSNTELSASVILISVPSKKVVRIRSHINC